MCGILGVFARPDAAVPPALLRRSLRRLFLLSETRGREAAGLAVRSKNALRIHKVPFPASAMVRTPEYRRLIDGALERFPSEPLAIIGHSRLVTNGSQLDAANNQPVARDGVVVVHNGIVVNHASLWARSLDARPGADVDSEVIAALLAQHRRALHSVVAATRETFSALEGTASIAAFFEGEAKAVLATNTGSLYVCRRPDDSVVLFASEAVILDRLLGRRALQSALGRVEISQLKAGHGLCLGLEGSDPEGFKLGSVPRRPDTPMPIRVRLNRDVQPAGPPRMEPDLRRCSRCVLPETMPYIRFDEDGVCSYCRGYVPHRAKGEDALLELLARYRSRDGSPDCILAFSGGRDSCYALHRLRADYGMTPVAMTYDWGMVTDLARRNQARLCGRLGVEHIIVSADIAWKRSNIGKNIRAWLKRPRLGMVPLFMAGDKFFFYYMNKVRKQVGVELAMFCVNPFEDAVFKHGFAGIRDAEYYDFSLSQKLQIAGYYGREYLLNPAYVNSSLLDTAAAYLHSYFGPHNWDMFFDYLAFDEDEVAETLVSEYDWELDPYTRTTWRIGDGSAPFYNYIYHTVAGLTEHDTFRSAQVREGLLDRNQALALVQEDNQPRLESMREYLELVGVDYERAKATIDAMPKLYAP